MLIRAETDSDHAAIRVVQTAAFGRDNEAALVDALRGNIDPFISLVAEIDGRIVGHILFTPVTLPGKATVKLLSLAPIAVLPDFQKDGVGSELVHEGLVMCEHEGVDAVVTLGGTDFYPRFGFRAASDFGLATNFPGMEQYFQARELSSGALENAGGTVEYPAAFGNI